MTLNTASYTPIRSFSRAHSLLFTQPNHAAVTRRIRKALIVRGLSKILFFFKIIICRQLFLFASFLLMQESIMTAITRHTADTFLTSTNSILLTEQNSDGNILKKGVNKCL